MAFRVSFTAIRVNAAQIPPAAIQTELRFFTKEHMDTIVGELTTYPPPVPSWYVRTGRYGLYMVVRNTSSGGNIQYTMTNPVQDRWGRYYAGYVGGASSQTAFHAAHGWKRVTDKLLKRARFQSGVQAIITKGIRYS